MAGKGTIGGKIVLEGESQYRAALKNIKTDQAELRSEMKLCQSSFKENQNSLEALQTRYGILTRQVSTQADKVKIYQQALETSSKKEETAAQKVSALKDELDRAEKEMEEMAGSSGETSEAVESQTKVIEELKNKLALAEQDYEKASRSTASYQTSLNYAEAELQEMQRELDRTGRYIREAENSTDQCADSIDEYGRETDEAAEKTSVFADVLKAELLSEAIKTGITVIAKGIEKVASSASEAGSSFEASMSQVAATMGMTTEEVNNGSAAYTLLSDTAKECGKTTKFSASEAAEALNYLALAGSDAGKSAETLPKVLDLAAAGGLDLAYASDLVTDSMAALGMETSELDGYIDAMARTSQKSNTSVAQLGEATLVCAGTVSLAGQSIVTMNTELGILANRGIKGAEGGTHLRNVILSLAAPTDKAAIALKELGVTVSDSNGDMRDLNDITADLNVALKDMSSTEKTQMLNRIFNKTDIAAVNALLEGTGEEYDNLRAELEKCDGAAAAMAETLNDNLKGKITILNSALEGLGISAYEIFDDDMKTAVDAATRAVGRLQDSVDNGKLGVSLNSLSLAMGEFASEAIDVGEDALPVVIDGLTWLLNHADLIVSGITGIVAANVQMKVVAPAVEAVSAAWNAYKAANEGATVTQWLLNTAMSANPAGLLVTSIVALTAAVGAYIVIHKDEVGVLDDTTRATRALVKESQELNETYGKASGSREESRAGLEAEAESCQKLVSELKDLQNKTELTATEQVRQKMIVDELNQALPELNLCVEEQTGKINMSTEALEANVEAMMAMARADAAREDAIRIAEEQYEAEKKLAALEKQLTEQKEAVRKAQDELNASIEEHGIMGVVEAQVLEQATQAQKDLEKEIAATTVSIDTLTDEYKKTMEYISDTEAFAQAAAAAEELGEAAGESGIRMQNMSEAAQEAYAEMYDGVSEVITNQISLFEEFDGKAELSTEKLLENMQSQVDGIKKWSENMEELAERGIDQGLLQHLADMGPEGAGYVATFASMTDEELKKANELWEQSLLLPDTAAQAIAESYTIAGEMTTQGFSDGITSGQKGVIAAVEITMDQVIRCMETKLDIHSPSRVTREIGQNADEGLELGIRDRTKNVVDQMGLTTADVIAEARRVLNRKDFRTIGETTDEGMREGILGKHSVLVSQMSVTSGAVLNTAKNKLTQQEFKGIGERSQGIKTGISNKHSAMVTQMSTTSGAILNAAKNKLTQQEFKGIGERSQGIKTGISNKESDATSQMKTTATKIVDTAKDNLPKSSFSSIGENIVSGLTSAISNGTSKVVTSIKDLCTAAVKEAKKKLDINSPSRVFYEIGDYTGQGFIKGWQDSMANINSIIAGSMPDGSMPNMDSCGAFGRYDTGNIEEVTKIVKVDQQVHIYAQTDDLIETSRKFRQSMKEAGEAW